MNMGRFILIGNIYCDQLGAMKHLLLHRTLKENEKWFE